MVGVDKWQRQKKFFSINFSFFYSLFVLFLLCPFVVRSYDMCNCLAASTFPGQVTLWHM